MNDIPPVFLTTSGPVTLDDNVSIGTIVTTLVATDSDGTAPGNKVIQSIPFFTCNIKLWVNFIPVYKHI